MLRHCRTIIYTLIHDSVFGADPEQLQWGNSAEYAMALQCHRRHHSNGNVGAAISVGLTASFNAEAASQMSQAAGSRLASLGPGYAFV